MTIHNDPQMHRDQISNMLARQADCEFKEETLVIENEFSSERIIEDVPTTTILESDAC